MTQKNLQHYWISPLVKILNRIIRLDKESRVTCVLYYHFYEHHCPLRIWKKKKKKKSYTLGQNQTDFLNFFNLKLNSLNH